MYYVGIWGDGSKQLVLHMEGFLCFYIIYANFFSGLRDLVELQWLNLSGNSIKV